MTENGKFHQHQAYAKDQTLSVVEKIKTKAWD